MTDFAVTTIATANFLHYATALGRSLRRCNPGVPFYVCVVDRPSREFPPLPAELGHCFFADELGIPGWARLSFQYSALNLSQAMKPFAAEKVMFESGCAKVIFLDSDILVTHSFAEYAALLDRFDLVLSPHLASPLAVPEREGIFTDLSIKRCGVYNSGFVGMKAGPTALAFLRWWQTKLRKLCVMDLAAHIFVDQSWVDLVPALFPNVHVERGLQYNVAHWNAAQRPLVGGNDGQFEVGGRPLVFFHFSGFDPNKPSVLSKYHHGFPIQDHPAIRELMRRYNDLLDDCGRAVYARIPYGYARLRDGTPIKAGWREAVRLDLPILADVADPFDTEANPGLRTLYAQLDHEGPQPTAGTQSRLQQLEVLYTTLNNSPILGRLLRQYNAFRAAAPARNSDRTT